METLWKPRRKRGLRGATDWCRVAVVRCRLPVGEIAVQKGVHEVGERIKLGLVTAADGRRQMPSTATGNSGLPKTSGRVDCGFKDELNRPDEARSHRLEPVAPANVEHRHARRP